MRVLILVVAALGAMATGSEQTVTDLSAHVAKHRQHRHECASGNAAKCNTVPRHAHHVKTEDSSPNQWNTPVLGPPTTHRDRRHARVQFEDGSQHFMHVGQGRNFTGVTPYGYLEHSSEIMMKNTTILVEDFMTEIKASAFTCTAIVAADGSPADEHTMPFHLLGEVGLIRNPVRMTMTVNRAKAAKAGFLDLLRERFVTDNSLVFGGDVFIEHRDFGVGKSCGVQIPFDSPFYVIADAMWVGNNVLHLALLPTTYQDLVLIANVKHAVNPNVDEALAQRAAAGLAPGDLSALPAYNARRRLAALSVSGSISVNWNGKVGTDAGATTTSKDIITGFITCKDCYAYMTPTVTLDLKMCAVMGVVGATKYWYYYWDTSLAAPTEFPGGKTNANTFTATYTSPCAPPADKLCVPAASADCNSFGMTATPFSIVSLQTGFSIDAYVSGQAGFSYTLIQKPFTGTTSTCSSSTTTFNSDTTAEACTVTLFDWLTTPASLSLQSSGIPLTMTINGRLRAAMQVTGAYDGAIQFGRTWSAGTTADPFKLGAKVWVPKMFTDAGTFVTPVINFATSVETAPSGTTVTIIPYNNFPTNNQLQATKILAPTLLNVKPEAYFYLDVQMSVWGTVPIVGYARAHVIASFATAVGAASTTASSGSATAGTSVALGYSSGRNSAVTALTFGASSCPANINGVAQAFGSVSLGVDVSVGLLQQVTLASIKPLKDALDGIADPYTTIASPARGNLDSLLASAVLFNAKTASYTNVLGGITGMNMFSVCVALSAARRLGEARSLVNTCPSSGCVYTYDDSNVYAASQAPGSSGGGTDSTSAASGSSSSLGTGAIVGIIIGALAGVALIAVGVLAYTGKIEIPGISKKSSPVSGQGKKGAAASKVAGSNPMSQKKSFDAGGGF